MRDVGVPAWRSISRVLALGGQPTEAAFQALAADGLRIVINLAPTATAEASLADEAGLLRTLGINYHHLPVSWHAPKLEQFEHFVELMNEAIAIPALVHCARNLRVTAFFAVYAERTRGWDRKRAEALISEFWGDRVEMQHGGPWRSFVNAAREIS